MQDNLFDTEEKVKVAISAFTNLLEQPGWKLYVQILDANIELIKQQLEEGIEAPTPELEKKEEDRLRDRLKVFRESRNKPQDMLAKFTSEDTEEINVDPYDTVPDAIVDNEAKKT